MSSFPSSSLINAARGIPLIATPTIESASICRFSSSSRAMSDIAAAMNPIRLPYTPTDRQPIFTSFGASPPLIPRVRSQVTVSGDRCNSSAISFSERPFSLYSMARFAIEFTSFMRSPTPLRTMRDADIKMSMTERPGDRERDGGPIQPCRNQLFLARRLSATPTTIMATPMTASTTGVSTSGGGRATVASPGRLSMRPKPRMKMMNPITKTTRGVERRGFGSVSGSTAPMPKPLSLHVCKALPAESQGFGKGLLRLPKRETCRAAQCRHQSHQIRRRQNDDKEFGSEREPEHRGDEDLQAGLLQPAQFLDLVLENFPHVLHRQRAGVEDRIVEELV